MELWNATRLVPSHLMEEVVFKTAPKRKNRVHASIALSLPQCWRGVFEVLRFGVE